MTIISELRAIRSDMHTRCNNPNFVHYVNYGGRGITLCDHWTGNSANFIEWALISGYISGLEIDRRDNDKGYSPENCRWVTSSINSCNRRKPITNTTGYIGVVVDNEKYRKKKFRVHIVVGGKKLLTSRHLTALEAAQAREQFIIDNDLPCTLNFK